MKAEIPNVIMVKVTINDELADDLEQVEGGFNHYQPAQAFTETPQQYEARQKERNEKFVGQAKDRRLDPHRFGKTSGRTMPDSGTPVFGREGQRHVSLTHIVEDITREFPEFALVSLNVQRRAMGKNLLWLVYSKPTENRQPITPTGAESFRIKGVLGRTYEHCHVWRNPAEQSITINVGAPMSDNASDALTLRIREQARSIRCVAAS